MKITLTAKGNRYFRLYRPGVPLSGQPLSQHTELANAYEAAVKDAAANGIDGVYTVRPPDGWEIEIMGFRVSTSPPPPSPGQLWLQGPVSVSEGQQFSFTVMRGAGSSGAVAVDWSITGLTEGMPAQSSGTVNFADGDTVPKTVTLTAGSVTANRSGLIILSNPRSTSGGAAPALGSSSVAITINDAPQAGWTNPNPTQVFFTQGTPGQFSFQSYAPQGAVNFALEASSPALPSGVTLDAPNKRFVYDGVGAPAIVTGVRIENVLGSDADWLARSTAPGVFFAHNFEYRNAAKTQLIQNVDDLIASSWDGEVQSDESLLEYDTVHKLSGRGACRINLRASQIGGYAGFRIGWDGIGVSTKNTFKTAFYFQFSYYIDQFWRDWFFNTPNYGGKIIIFQAPDRSFGTGEVVLRRDTRPGGWLSSYRIPAGRSSQLNRLFYPGLSRRANYAFYDRGVSFGSPVNSIDRLQLRHGPHTDGSDSTGTDPDYQHAPRLVANGFTTIETYINLAAQVIKVWIAPYGQPPTLIMGGMDYPGHAYMGLPAPGVGDGGTGKLYSGVQLTSYMNQNQWGGDGNWPTQDTFVVYDECIASDNPIPFPGGFALPFPGTQLPPGWPPTDTTPLPEGE